MILGILAHVDAGKTTLSEALLYKAGAIRNAGRVDHGDSHLDTDGIERARGITIFSSEARFTAVDARGRSADVTLLDTPGHVDFSAETERTLSVLDAALLVISATDGVQSHTKTLWNLLSRRGIPVLLFVNKMDLTERPREELLQGLRTQLADTCVDFTDAYACASESEEASSGKGTPKASAESFCEDCAALDEQLLDEYLDSGTLSESSLADAFARRAVFPVLFGSALKMEGVEALLSTLASLAEKLPAASDGPFSGRVYKIGRGKNGERLTWLKVLAGTFAVKDVLHYRIPGGEDLTEKIDQVRLYSGDRFETADKIGAGGLCAVTGLTKTRPGMRIAGTPEALTQNADADDEPLLLPVMTRALILPPDVQAAAFYRQLAELAEEDPTLQPVWDERAQEIRIRTMGAVQLEVLTVLIEERFGIRVSFGPGQILYKETLAEAAYGIGHFEPLRHYAEVQLLLEPGGRGSGITVASAVSEDVLALNWQRLILTHLRETVHPGVLLGAPLDDVKITIAAGRASNKHTEGGDFRQATYRAVRQGLMGASCLILEPWYRFELHLPADALGRAMTDLSAMAAEYGAPELSDDGTEAVLTGRVPAASSAEYASELQSYTHGLGSISLVPDGYGPCHNAEDVLAASSYQPEADTERPASSVFCAHGAGYVVPWDEVPQMAHCVPERGFEALLQERGIRASGLPFSGAGGRDSGADAFDPDDRNLFWEDGEEGPSFRAAKHTKKKEELSPEEDPELQAIYARAFGMTTDGIRTDAETSARRGWNRRPSAAAGTTVSTAGEAAGGTAAGGRDSTSANRNPYAAGFGKEAKYRKRTDAPDHRIKRDKKGNPIYPKKDERPGYLIVDGYNVIHQWPELADLARVSLDAARGKLLDILSDYQGYTEVKLSVVFDAYRTDRTPSSVTSYDRLEVVFTQKDMTADAWIERRVHECSSQYRITVATSDGMEQLTVMGLGALRMSARELGEEIQRVRQEGVSQTP